MTSASPKSWAEATFGSLNHFSSKTISPQNNPLEEFELYSVPAFPSGEPEICQGKDIGSTKQIVHKNTILVCKINPRINRVWKVPPSHVARQIASSEWIGFWNPGLSPRFYQYYFRSNRFRSALCSDVTGVGGSLTRAQPKKVATIAVPVAPINEQRRIADKLDRVLTRVDAANDHLSRITPLIKRFRQSVLAAATSGRLTEDLRKKDSNWNTTTIGEILADIRYGTAKKCSPSPKGTALLRIPNIGNYGKIELSDVKYAEFTQKEYESFSLKPGDILLIRSNGSVDLVGKTSIVDETSAGFLFAGYLMRLRFQKNLALPSYAQIALSSPTQRQRIESIARSTSGVNNINTEEVKSLSFHLPPLDEQATIVRRVEKLFAFADRLEKRLSQAQAAVQKLTPALLAKAFRGELVLQDPNDEPASELLKRLQESRADSAKPSRARKPRARKLP